VRLRAISLELYVRDAAAYAPLLEDVFGLMARRVSPAVVIYEGGPTVILHEGGADLPPDHPFAAPLQAGDPRGVGVEVCLEVADIAAAYEQVAALAGFRVATPLGPRPWGLQDFRVLTPDGYYLRIMEPR
jgi:hypothetical protein